VPHIYTEESCGTPVWEKISPGSAMPDRSLLAGYDSRICDGTKCGKEIFVSMASIGGSRFLGKTWFVRSDACSSMAIGVESVITKDDCRILTMGASSFGSVRFGWREVKAAGNKANRYDAPKYAFNAGNDANNHGPLYVCRFRDANNGDLLVGNSYFPRHDGHCCAAEYGGGVVHGDECEILTKEPCQT
jgi:hypothetical protein